MIQFIHSRDEFTQQLVVMHYREGWSIRALARHFMVSRNTIRRNLRQNDARRDEGHDAVLCRKKINRGSKLDDYAEEIKRLLEKYPQITGIRLFEELVALGYNGRISILRDYLRKIRPRSKRAPVVRFETEPGSQGQMDWSPYNITFRSGGKTQVQCFSYILGFSRRQYVDFTLRRDFYTLIRRHLDAFTHFGGVPAQCLYDSEKTVVLRWEAGKPVINPAFAVFATHYAIRPVICRRGRAETKGKIERPFQYIEGNLLCAREFNDLKDLQAQTRWWLREKNDIRIHETTGRPPLDLFLEQEALALHPLPRHPYDAGEVALRVCDVEGYIAFETNRYPVPYEYVADILTMKATENEVLVYSPELDLVVRHERLPAGAGVRLDGKDVHKSKTIRYGLEPVRDTFNALGEHAAEFLLGLQHSNKRNAGFHARTILQLKEFFACTDINLALGHASRYHAYDCRAVERILCSKATPRTLESIRIENANRELAAAMPVDVQRPLEEYTVLLKMTDQ